MRARFVPRKKKKSTPLNLFSVKTIFQGNEPDQMMLMSILGLLVFGWVLVYSSSALFAEARYGDQFFFLKRQLLWSLIGFAFFLAAANTSVSVWQKGTKVFYFLTIALLAAVLVVGPEIAGAKRWLRVGPFGIQPSEIAKLTMVFVVADYMDRRQSRLRDFKRGLAPLLGMVGFLLFLIFIEPDLGTPILMGSVLLSLLVLGGARLKHLFIMGLVTLPFISLAIFQVGYRVKRFFAYLDPWSDPHGSGYQLIQSLLAMGSGGIFGRGLGNSKIKIAHLPDAHTDFAFSVLGEELGLIGSLLVMCLFMFVALRGLKIAKHAKSTFSTLVAAGLSLMIGFQAIINMGVACGLFPTKGMPLPFLSFGGSSLVVTMISVGILAHISKTSKPSAPKGLE